jgi:hypothetical protein
MESANGAVKNGVALLAGLPHCGLCGSALQLRLTRSKHHGPLPRDWCAGDPGQQMVRGCITFAGARVDQVVATEVLEALRPPGVQAALEHLHLGRAADLLHPSPNNSKANAFAYRRYK